MKSILDTIGNTPLIKVENIYTQLETVNPSGSIKDRMAYYMVQKAEERGELKRGYTIIEVTSGNTGVSFAMISNVKGYQFIAVMPENLGKEKRKMMKFFGAKIVLTPAEKGFLGAMEKAKELSKKYKKVWLPKQFENPDNVEAHYQTTGKEILQQINSVDVFVAGIGTGGTLMGVAKALKEKFKNVKIFGVEAAESLHQIEGISDGIIPKILKFDLIDGMIRIKSKEAIKMTKVLAKKYGLLVGISSGANFLAAKKLTKKYKNVVTVFPDRGERYLSLL